MSEFEGSTSNVVSVTDSDTNNIDSIKREAEKVLPCALADFAGALSWQIPLSVEQKKQVLEAVRLFIAGLDDTPQPDQGLLELMNIEQPLAAEALRDPATALETLIAGTRGQALGLAVQTHLKGFASDVSVNDYALAALQLDLDPQSIENHQRNTVAGFDLGNKQHWGEPVATVFNKLREHLIEERVCNSEMAGLGAYLLLARHAPLFLIKDLPAAVKYGGPAWFNLSVAAATLEAESPGKVAKMKFAQVMVCAESAALLDPAVTQYAQTVTLIDWGVVHGLVERKNDGHYTPAELDVLKTRFNEALADRLNTPILLSSVFPSRKEIARAGLKKEFGEDYPIEERVLEWDRSVGATIVGALSPVPSAIQGPVGMHTLQEIAMMDGTYKWKTSHPLLKYRIHDINELDLRVRRTFNREFETTLNHLKEGTRLTIRHLISELPLEDRENIEYGKINFYQDKTIKAGLQFHDKFVRASNQNLTLRVEQGIDKKVSVYYIDLKAGSITKKDVDPVTQKDRVSVHIPSVSYGVRPFYLADRDIAKKLKRRPSPSWTFPVPDSYSSERTRIIADAFVEHLDYDSEDILKAAEGLTTWDQEVEVLERSVKFLLNLIPFKSAISNFIDGKYLDGAIDLFLDVLGFVTAGVSATAKLAQLGARTASALSKALKAAKIIGALVIGELNPFGAVVAGGKLLGMGAKYLGVKGLQQFDKFRDALFAYDLLIGVSKQHGPAALGTFKVGEHSIESVGVLKGSSWYPYSPQTKRLYGPPGNFRPSGPGGFGNDELRAFAVKPSVIAGLEPNAKGIFRSADGQSFYIRNIDTTGQHAFYQIKNDFSLSADLTDVIIVDRATNRAHGSRLWQVAPDQWQPVSLRGGDLPAGAADVPAGAIVDESASLANPLVHTSTNPLNADAAFVRDRLPNGLWEPVMETVSSAQTAHLPIKSSRGFSVPFTLQSTSIQEALAAAELSRFPLVTELMEPYKFEYSDLIISQLENKKGGAKFTFVMERVHPADNIGAEFNALRIHDTHTKGLVKQANANAVDGYWAPQGGYVDIPVHPEWTEPGYVFTPGFSGCSMVVDQIGLDRLRVRHVEAGHEFPQYNGLAREEHGGGLSAAMEFHDYGLRVDQNGNADAILTGFAFMKYDRTTRSWTLHFQSSYEAPRIGSYSSPLPKGRREIKPLVELQSGSRVVKVETRQVSTMVGAIAP